MQSPSPSLRRGRTWLVAAAVVAALALVLGLQYRALVRLEETSAASQRMSLRAHARAILQDVEDFYRAQARALDVPAQWLDPALAPELGARLAARTRGGEGVSRFFGVRFAPDGAGAVAAFAPDGRADEAPADS